MDAKDKTDFDQAHGELVQLRNQADCEERFDAFMAEAAPLIFTGLDAGAAIAAPFIPGGPLVQLGERAGVALLKGAFQRWLEKNKPQVSA